MGVAFHIIHETKKSNTNLSIAYMFYDKNDESRPTFGFWFTLFEFSIFIFLQSLGRLKFQIYLPQLQQNVWM